MFLPSKKTEHLKQSAIRRASTRCAEIGGINLGQGICDMPMPQAIKEAAYAAIDADKSLYSACAGVYKVRQAVANKLREYNQLPVTSAEQVMITHGSTGAFVCACASLFNPGDEVILFEPFYGYHKQILAQYDVKTISVSIALDNFAIDMDELAAKITPRTKAMVICTPCNPCGKVFSRAELLAIGEIARQHDLHIITDEIYEYITYPGHDHISIASLEDLAERTVTISGFSKTYNMTGWRLGYVAAPAALIARMELVQDLLYVCPVTPLQHAMLAALALPDTYYSEMRQNYLIRRDQVVSALQNCGFQVAVPQGAYYLLADISGFDYPDDQAFADDLLERGKVAVVPGRAFYSDPEAGRRWVRFCYALREEKVTQALIQVKNALA